MFLLKRYLGLGLVQLLILFLLTGCVQTLSLITLPLTGIQLGTMAYQSIEKADINAAVVSGVTKKDLEEIKHVAIFWGQENPTQTHERMENLGTVVGDNLRIELMKLGFLVCDESKIVNSAQTDLSTDKMANLGVQAIISGKITPGQIRSFGMLGVGRINTVVQSVSMKIIGAKNSNTLMIVTIDYKKGQNPQAAAEDIATVLKTKLEDPFLDIKEMG